MTKEQARVASEDFLWDSKVGMRHSMFMIEEYIENHDTELTKTKSTTIALSKGGDNFFIGYISNWERYLRMVKYYDSFMNRIAAKVRELGHEETANKIEQNYPLIKEYLVMNKWTRSDLAGQEWRKNKYNISYGKGTNKRLLNTQGVEVDR